MSYLWPTLNKSRDNASVLHLIYKTNYIILSSSLNDSDVKINYKLYYKNSKSRKFCTDSWLAIWYKRWKKNLYTCK